MTNALRPSDLLVFRWKCFDYDEVRFQAFVDQLVSTAA
jgi:hypothetical protein